MRALVPVLSIAGAALPSILLVLYFRRLDRKRPEPRGLVLRSVALGFLAVLPAILIEMALEWLLPKPGGLAGAALKGFVVAGLVEECVKFAFVYAWIYSRKEFDEVADGIVYTVCVSLGFALVENVMYGFSYPGSILIRAFTAVPMHAAASGLMGYRIGLAKTGLRKKAALGLLAAVLVHGVYDFFAFSGNLLALLVFPTVIVSFAVVVGIFKKAVALDDAARGPGPLENPGVPGIVRRTVLGGAPGPLNGRSHP